MVNRQKGQISGKYKQMKQAGICNLYFKNYNILLFYRYMRAEV